MKTLSQEISGYEEAVKELSEANNSDLSSVTLRALIERDKAATTLGKEGINSSHIDCVAETDRQLRDQATRVDSAIGRETLQQWRLTRTPDDKAWWWSLDDLAATSQSKRVWTVIAVFLLTIAVYFAVDTFNLLRTVGESPIGTLGALIQGSLAVVAASAFTEAGRKRFVSALTHFGFKGRPFKGFARMLLATAVLALTIVIHSLLPASVAYYFQRQGERFQSEGLVQRAISAYQQALLLQPYSIPTHLALAKAAEKANDYAKAIAEYKSTIVLYEQTRKPDDSYYEAQINLARLLIQHEKNYSQVLRMLDKPEEMIGAVSPQNRKPYTYFFWTYRGWANFELHSYAQADGELREALKQRRDGAAAHYLLARTWERQDEKNADKAKEKLSQFLTILQQDSKQTDEVLPDWISYAQEKVLARRLE